MFTLTLPLSIWIPCIGLTIWLAVRKNRNVIGWGLLSIAIAPLALLAIFGMPPIDETDVHEYTEPPVSDEAKPWNPVSGPPAG